MAKEKKPKMLLFRRDFNGFSVDPYSIIAWLYHNKAPKLAEQFSVSTNKIIKSLEKQWQKDISNNKKELLPLKNDIKEDDPKKELPKLKWWQRKIRI